MESQRSLRIGVLGAGSHSRLHHGPTLQKCAEERPALHLAAVCDLDADKARAYARDFGFANVYTDLNRMLREEHLDGLVAVTPMRLTREIVSNLLPHHIPLLIEKPPGKDSEEARQLVRAARQSGTPHMVSLNRRFSPALLAAADWIRENAADRPVDLVQGQMLRTARREPDFLTWTGIHCVDAVLSWLPPVTRVKSRRWASPGGGQAAVATIEAGESRRACLTVVPDAGVNEETYALFGPEYVVRIDTVRCSLTIHDREKIAVQWQAPAEMPDWEKCGALDETRAFLDAVDGRRPFSPDLAAAAASMVVAEAVDTGGQHCWDADSGAG